MKKIFTLIVLAAMTLCANAFTDTWSSSSTATSPVALTNITATFQGTWTFSNNYAAGSENGQAVVFTPTADGNLTIIFGGSIATSKKLHMRDESNNGLTAKLASNNTVTIADNTSPTAQINSNDGVVYALEAGKTYTFSVSGTTWRLASLKFTNEKEIEYTTEWNFSTWDSSTGLTNQVKDNLGILASYKDADNEIKNFAAIASSNKGSYTKCLKTGGNGSPLEGTGTPTQRFLYFNVNGNADIFVHCLAGGDGDRYLVISDGKNVLTKELTSKNLTEVKYSYQGEAGIICLYSENGAVNLYDIKANNVGTTILLDDTTKPTGINAIETTAAAPAVQKYVENGKLVIEKAGKKFNAAGAQLK